MQGPFEGCGAHTPGPVYTVCTDTWDNYGNK